MPTPGHAGAEPSEEGDAERPQTSALYAIDLGDPDLANCRAGAGRAGWGLAVEEADQFAALPVG